MNIPDEILDMDSSELTENAERQTSQMSDVSDRLTVLHCKRMQFNFTISNSTLSRVQINFPWICLFSHFTIGSLECSCFLELFFACRKSLK